MTEIEKTYYNNREALIDEICELEEQIGNLVELGELHKDDEPSEFFPRCSGRRRSRPKFHGT